MRGRRLKGGKCGASPLVSVSNSSDSTNCPTCLGPTRPPDMELQSDMATAQEAAHTCCRAGWRAQRVCCCARRCAYKGFTLQCRLATYQRARHAACARCGACRCARRCAHNSQFARSFSAERLACEGAQQSKWPPLRSQSSHPQKHAPEVAPPKPTRPAPSSSCPSILMAVHLRQLPCWLAPAAPV